ncbi:MAG: hypothetical protein EOP04_02445 [Proteobacteria bacterium]|nr:MAG: hypothetical protein EOP04_02445 [Pseudomonadota bacterium]
MNSPKNIRNKEVTEQDLQHSLEGLLDLEKRLTKEVATFIQIGGSKGELLSMDYFISAIVNRAISLISGFQTLGSINNYIAAVPIIRMQVDNILRLFAATIAPNRDKFFQEYLAGEHIGNMKDVNGKRMTDSYLAKKVDSELYPGILNLYQNTSGYVHLSNVHAFLQVEIEDENKGEMRTFVGRYDFWKIDEKVDFAFNMFKSTEFLYRLVRGWTLYKNNLYKPDRHSDPN